MTRTAHIALLVLLVVLGALSHAVGALAAEDDASSILIINGRVVEGERSGNENVPRTRHGARTARPAPRQVPQAKTIFHAPRVMIAFAVQLTADHKRMVRVARASKPAGQDRQWYRAGVRRSITYVSRPSGDLQLDVWYPRERSTPAPTIMLVHGGGWRAGGREEWDRVGWTRQLVHRGYVVIAPSYRMSCKPGALKGASKERTDERLCGFSMAELIVDVRRALGWVHRNVDDHGGDPDQVVLVGASAGGHLALMAGADRGAFVRGVAAISPATDLSWFGKRPRAVLYGAARQSIGCPLRRCPSQWSGSSPSTLAARAHTWPATYVFDAVDDHVTPGEQNKALFSALSARGAVVTRRHPVRTGSQCHGTYSCSQWAVAGTGRSLLDDIDAWVLGRVR